MSTDYAPIVREVGGLPSFALSLIVFGVLILSGMILFVAMWRGVPRLGIPGLGTEIRDDLREVKVVIVRLSASLEAQLEKGDKTAVELSEVRIELAEIRAENRGLIDRLARLEAGAPEPLSRRGAVLLPPKSTRSPT